MQGGDRSRISDRLPRSLNHFSFACELGWLRKRARLIARIILQISPQLRGFACIDQPPQLLTRRRLEIQFGSDTIEDLDVVYRDAITRLEIESRENFRSESQHFQIC